MRAAVGNAQTPEDRLATLRRFAPDARPFGTDNFVYTDRRTGRLTVYNPKGLDRGDFASIMPEVGEMAGGAIGAAAIIPPAVAGAPATGGASFLAVPAGVGLGAAAGREIATGLGRMFGGTVDTRSLPRQVGDTAVTAGLNAAGVPVGNLVATGARAALGPVQRMFGRTTGPAALDDFANAAVTPDAASVTGNRTWQSIAAALKQTPGGAEPITAQAERQVAEAGAEAGRIASAYGTPTNPYRVGETIREGAASATQRFRDRQEQLYDDAFKRIGADTAVDISAVDALATRLRAEIAKAPESRRAVLQPVIDRLESLSLDAGNAGIRFDALRAIRTDLGRLLGAPPTAAGSPSSDTAVYLRQLYGALTDDMGAAARQAGPEAERALSLADRYTRFHSTQNMPVLDRILNNDLDRDIFRMALPANGRPDAQSLARLRRNLTPEEWSVVQATFLDRMGMPNAGQAAGETFSVNTFLTNWNKLMQDGGGARAALFGGGGQNAQLASELDRLVRVTERLRDADRMANRSNTGNARFIGGGALGVGLLAGSGDLFGATALAALSAVGPRVAANLITKPEFVRWLGGAARAPAGESSRVLARLGAVAEANPEIRDAIEAFQAAATSLPAPTDARQRQQPSR
ncbi:MAG: hypothetical protein KGR68_03770 [Betaproteobacteria bacterium]|nr:hypothetical protein [Betaproteobacteria bacterium]